MNSYVWKRKTSFVTKVHTEEIWTLEKDRGHYDFLVDVKFGKKIDLVNIKKEWPYEREIEFTKKVIGFFEAQSQFVRTEKCPVCFTDADQSVSEGCICGMNYLRCEVCNHIFARYFPSENAVETYYRENLANNTYYINPHEIELRIKEIYLPKIEWICDAYRKIFGRNPESILDIGAGSGHFLFACKRQGLLVNGIEFSRSYKDWCREHFGIELHGEIGELEDQSFDVVCSFNVIEHVYNPSVFIADYKKVMNENSLAVIETPRVNSLTTCLQKIFPEEPRGNLIPYEHNHLFTDASLATLLFENNLAVKSVWYFGQDVAELILRIFAELGMDNPEVFSRMYDGLQGFIDMHHASNLMICAAVPWQRPAETVCL